MSKIEQFNINAALDAACCASTITQLDKVIGRCLRNKFGSINELGRSLIKDLSKMENN